MRTHGSSKMNINVLLLTLASVLIISPRNGGTSQFENTAWRRAGKMTGLFLDSCFRSLRSDTIPEQLMALLQTCIEKRVSIALQRAVDEDVIGISDGVELVRYEGNSTSNNRYSGVVQKSYPHIGEDGWRNVEKSIEKLVHTHVLRIHLNNFNKALDAARGHRKNMFNQMLMFGVVVASLIVIPLGFQFLTILGGKALLLSKMALILTSIQGLKKIATSNFNYGLYSYRPEAYGSEPYGPWHYDRQWQQDGHGLQNYGNLEEYRDALHPRKDLLHDFQTT